MEDLGIAGWRSKPLPIDVHADISSNMHSIADDNAQRHRRHGPDSLGLDIDHNKTRPNRLNRRMRFTAG